MTNNEKTFLIKEYWRFVHKTLSHPNEKLQGINIPFLGKFIINKKQYLKVKHERNKSDKKD